MTLLRRLFCLAKPGFINLDYINMIIEDKMLLLLCWEIQNYARISIPILKKSYSAEQSAILVRLPEGTTSIELVVRSAWRKRKYTIPVRMLQLDRETSAHLVQQLVPFLMQTIKQDPVMIRQFIRQVDTPSITVKTPGIRFRSNTITIHSGKLVYST